MEVYKEGYGPNVLKAMVLEKTENIYKSLDIKDMKVVNVSGGQTNSTTKFIAEAIATYGALSQLSDPQKKVQEVEEGTLPSRHYYRDHATANSLNDVNQFFKWDTNSALSRNLT
jgi:hypothetical protein